ncbi:Aminomethyltransferase [Dactylella cylindrospora]|nr:Aminomethyltransferase [Dactylella cylindrospora]
MSSRTVARRVIDLSRRNCIQRRAISSIPRVQSRPNQLLPQQAAPITKQQLHLHSKPISNVRYASTAAESLRKTPLYDLHVRYGGKMVEFGGFSMPVQYSDQGIGDSHRWVREKCGLFDVSHMVQHQFTGTTVTAFLESLTPSDLQSLLPFTSTLSVLLNPTGGIVDDTIITKHSDTAFYVVTNAGCRDKDLAYFSGKLAEWNAKVGESDKVRHDVMADHGLVALQGPEAKNVLQTLVPGENLDELFFGQSQFATISVDGVETVVHIARGGYTGEDGFEISIPADQTEAITEALLKANGGVTKLAGLGARDSLRLEAGMCLYGHDLTGETTPVEGTLLWVIAKSRRAKADFPGADVILKQIKDGVEKKRVGLLVTGAPAREGVEIVDKQSGDSIGYVTSGCPSPSLGKNIAMGYVKDKYKKAGTEVGVKVRGKVRDAVVAKMPFVQTKYHKP